MGHLIEQIPLLSSGKYLALLTQIKQIQENTKNYHSQYKSIFGNIPILWGIGLKSIKEGKLYSFFVDNRYFRVKEFSMINDTHYESYLLEDVLDFRLERGELMAIVSISHFLKITLNFPYQTFTFYIVTNNLNHFSIVERKLPPIIENIRSRQNQSKPEETTEDKIINNKFSNSKNIFVPTTNKTKEENIREYDNNLSDSKELTDIQSHYLLLWDYDNIPLKKNIPMDLDDLAQSLRNIINEIEFYDSAFCVSANSMSDLELIKIKMIHKSINVIRVVRGQDSTDKNLDRYASDFLKQYSKVHITLISGDHYYIPTIKQSVRKGAELLVIHKGNISRKFMEAVSDLHLINLSLIRKSKLVECKVCKAKVDDKKLGEHMTSHNDSYCSTCDKYFSSPKGLQQHNTAKHGKYKCYYCSNTFGTKHEVKNHLLNSHKNILAEITCTVCGKVLICPQSKISHQKSHNLKN